jgi:hypothetical protein
MARFSPFIFGFLLLLLGATLWPADARAEPDLPKMKVVVERLSQSLGGPKGGLRLLEKSAELDFIFHRSVRDSLSRETVEADHRLVRKQGGVRLRLDVRVGGDDGIDSASVIDGEQAWVIAEGERHEADAGALRSRLSEFAPERLFSVPLTLALEGRELLAGADLQISRERDKAGDRLILRGGEGDSSGVRIVLDGTTYRPIEVAFRSLSGDVVYRYEDYREVAPGLILPFVREFHRNGIRVSRTTVRRFDLHVASTGDLFSPQNTALPKLPKGR